MTAARSSLAAALAVAAGMALAQEGSTLAPGSAPSPQPRPDAAAGSPAPEPVAPPDAPPEEREPPAAEAVPRPEPRAEEAPSRAPPAPAGGAAEGERPALIPPEELEQPDAPEQNDAPGLADAPEQADAPEEPDAPEEVEAPEAPNSPRPAEESEPAAPPMPERLAESPEELAACLAALDELGVAYETAEPLPAEDPACGIANPLTVSALPPGVALEPPPTMRCEAALAAARWVADVAAPLARKLGRGELVAIDQGTSYLCRPRADGEMSEHAWGNAIDVMGFRFAAGEPIPVVPRLGDGTIEEAFQRAVRAGACLDFATVLGPGSDADHADHLHLDVKARDGGFRICE